jgi:hypothetical protein
MTSKGRAWKSISTDTPTAPARPSSFFSFIEGRLAQTCFNRSVADYVADTTTPTQWLASEFAYLAARFIGWETAVSCPPTARGKYFVNTSYLPNSRHTFGVAKLSETKGQVITRNVEAKSGEIEIR